MYLREISINGFRNFNNNKIIKLNKGLNVLVGENGSGKSTVIDAIRMLLNEDEASRTPIKSEDFYTSLDKKNIKDEILISGIFSELTEKEKIEYLTCLDENFNAKINYAINNKKNKRNMYKKQVWGGDSLNSAFDFDLINNIQCVYLPPLRDAERKLKSTRGSRLARLLINLSKDELIEKRTNNELTEIEEKVKEFNNSLIENENIKRANNLINSSLQKSLGDVFSQSTKIQFEDVQFEKIVESLKLLFLPFVSTGSNLEYRNLFENSLGYNNLIYLATILAEFEGLKEAYSEPRILLIEELEAHLHPQIQNKVLKFLKQQADENNIQVIITTHSTEIVSSTPIENIITFNRQKDEIRVVSLKDCVKDKKSINFINRWLDSNRSQLLFSKGNILVEGLAEAILIPQLAEIYLKMKDSKYKSLEDAGISVINMGGIFFNYFFELYNGYNLKLPQKKDSDTKKQYKETLNNFIKKETFDEKEYEYTDYIPIRCVALTDRDVKNIDDDKDKSTNHKLYLEKQVENMTSNCRVFINKKTFEYDLILEENNQELMIDIILDELTTNGELRKILEKYKQTYILENTFIDDKVINEMASTALKCIDGADIGKGLFAQLLLEKLEQEDIQFEVPKYIKDAIDFVLGEGDS